MRGHGLAGALEQSVQSAAGHVAADGDPVHIEVWVAEVVAQVSKGPLALQQERMSLSSLIGPGRTRWVGPILACVGQRV
ncbi:hypothetical protein, partial [Mycobacterium gordonae]|uniref:hypothetical protein n=1 Tax=Mycobacterium gordonae TaxID=1778 RepID=UPI001E3E7414